MLRSAFFPLLLATLLCACSGEPASSPEKAADAAAGEAEAASASSAEKPAGMPRSPAPEGARVFFITPEDGATVSSPFSIEFGIEGMTVAPAGTDRDASGHHHLIINAELPPLDRPVPANDNYIHFGDGSTETTLELEPGTHTLQLLLGDHLHVPHDPPVKSGQITVIVE